MSDFKSGVIAICSRGSLGLITKDEPQPVTYPDGTKGEAWVGIHLTSKISPAGSGWSSRTPKYVGTLEEVICCEDFKQALKDQNPVLGIDLILGACLLTSNEGLIPVSFCPWCGRERPKTLATSPAMLYRP